FFFDGETKTTARGILLYGKSVGLRQFQDDADKWHRQIDPHRFHNNHYERLRLNLAGPQKVHQDMHLVVAERAVHLTGEGDAVQFSWPDD
ncbi:MAG: hypothetical protein VX704_08175, partial [Verrucomicrobiota bacterium]|nr:hypothetical protein [Verrucomicrobiota bacterium]